MNQRERWDNDLRAPYAAPVSPASPGRIGFPSAIFSIFLRPDRSVAVPKTWADRGASLVEFAVIFMFFMTMLLGIVEFSRALYAYHFVDHAAKTATRWAAVNGYTCTDDSSCNGTGGMNNGPASAANINDYVKNGAPMGIDPNRVTATATWPQQPNSPAICGPTATNPNPPPPFGGFIDNYPGCTVEVQVSYEFHFLFPFVHNGPITLSSSSEMIISH
jgi:Flp pilus assembly protein TadG